MILAVCIIDEQQKQQKIVQFGKNTLKSSTPDTRHFLYVHSKRAASVSQHALLSDSVGGLQLPVLCDFRLQTQSQWGGTSSHLL